MYFGQGEGSSWKPDELSSIPGTFTKIQGHTSVILVAIPYSKMGGSQRSHARAVAATRDVLPQSRVDGANQLLWPPHMCFTTCPVLKLKKQNEGEKKPDIASFTGKYQILVASVPRTTWWAQSEKQDWEAAVTWRFWRRSIRSPRPSRSLRSLSLLAVPLRDEILLSWQCGDRLRLISAPGSRLWLLSLLGTAVVTLVWMLRVPRRAACAIWSATSLSGISLSQYREAARATG